MKDQRDRFVELTGKLYGILDSHIDQSRSGLSVEGYAISTAGQRFTGNFEDYKRREHVVVVRHGEKEVYTDWGRRTVKIDAGVTAIAHMDDLLFYLAHRKVWEEFKDECKSKGLDFDEKSLLRDMNRDVGGGIPAKCWYWTFDPPFAKKKSTVWNTRPYLASRQEMEYPDAYHEPNTRGDEICNGYERMCLEISQNGGPVLKRTPLFTNNYAKAQLAFFAPSPVVPIHTNSEWDNVYKTSVYAFFSQMAGKLFEASETSPPDVDKTYLVTCEFVPLSDITRTKIIEQIKNSR